LKSDKTNGKPADGNSDSRKGVQSWGTSTATFYYDIEGVSVKIHLMMGNVLPGVVVGVDTFDLVFKQNGGSRVLIPKHAIAYLEQPAK